MAKKEEKVNFDLSVLDLHELIDVYNNIDEFLSFLKENKIEVNDKEEDEDE
ncbi:MAG: hypothetical protein IJ399_01180 [Bacilli bacterium]|nr:hypothetical protein [Bacilli bacterium]